MKLNTNIASLKVLNTMNQNNSRLEKSIERLSSGYKINKAADDATGLAISRKMQVQIDALTKAEENANDGISLIQTAEGALNEVHSILQRMRELAVQSSNGSLSTDDRLSAQSEIDMLIQEVDRISSTVQFNNMNLLDGSIDSKTYSNNERVATVISSSEGVKAGTYEFEITNAATKTSLLSGQMNRGLFGPDGKCNIQGTIFINGADVEIKNTMTEDDVFAALRDAAELSDITLTSTTGKLQTLDSTGENNTTKLVLEHQIAGEKEIKLTGDEHILFALGLKNAVKDSTSVDEYQMTAPESVAVATGKSFILNGAEIVITEDMNTFDKVLDKISTFDVPGIAISKNETTGAYTLDSAFFELVCDDATLKTTIMDALGTPTTNASGTALLNGMVGKNAQAVNFSYDDPTNGKVLGFPQGTTASADGNLITFTGPDGFELLVENSGQVGQAKLVITTQGRMDLQIGANNGQTMVIRIPNMSSKAIGIENVNIRTRETAEQAITYLDAAIANVSEVRSRLGAFQNRLDYTVNSLSASGQNLTESLSRILDTDMADEMSTYTQNNILAEAGISILAQANQRPQGILTLLQNMI